MTLDMAQHISSSMSRVITPGVGYDHNMVHPNVGDGSRKNGVTEGDGARKDRGSPTWYQDLANYYDRRARENLKWWDAVEEEYDGARLDHTIDNQNVLEEIRPGRVYSLVHTIEAMTFNRRPKLFLRGWNAKVQEQWVPTLEEVLNAEWYDNPQLPSEVRMCIRDCAKTGWGVMRTTYDWETRPVPADVPVQESSPVLEDAIDEAEGDAAADAAEASPFDPEVSTWEQDDRAILDNINSRRVSPRLFMIDPDARSESDAKWMGRKIIADLYAVKEYYKDHPRIDELSATERSDLDYAKRRSSADQSPYQYVTLYEFWERIPGGGWRMVLVPKDHDFFLAEEENPYYSGCPYSLLSWNQTGEDIFCQSDVIPAWSLILAERIALTKLLDGYTREHEDTVFYDKSAGVNEEELNAIADPGVVKYVGVNNANGRRMSDNFFKPSKDPKSPEVLQLLSILERQFQVATGLGPNQFGQALRSGTSASESMEVAGFARARGAHKFGAVEEFVAGIAFQRLALMVQFYDAERVARIAGRGTATEWVKIKRALDHPGEVQKNLRVRVEQGSLKPENDDVRLQQLFALLQVGGQSPALMASFNLVEIMRDISSALGHHRGNRYLLTEDPNEIAKAQAAAMLMQNGGAGGGGGSAPKARNAPASSGQAQQMTAGPAMGGGAPTSMGG